MWEEEDYFTGGEYFQSFEPSLQKGYQRISPGNSQRKETQTTKKCKKRGTPHKIQF